METVYYDVRSDKLAFLEKRTIYSSSGKELDKYYILDKGYITGDNYLIRDISFYWDLEQVNNNYIYIGKL